MIKFGTSGWRGIIARDFTFDNVRLVTQAIAEYVKAEAKKKQKKAAVIIMLRLFPATSKAKLYCNVINLSIRR